MTLSFVFRAFLHNVSTTNMNDLLMKEESKNKMVSYNNEEAREHSLQYIFYYGMLFVYSFLVDVDSLWNLVGFFLFVCLFFPHLRYGSPDGLGKPLNCQ